MASSKRKKMKQPESTVRSIIADILLIDDDQVTPASRLQEDLEMDSLDMVEACMLAEEKFGIAIDEGKVEKIVTFADFERLVAGAPKASAEAELAMA